MRATVHLLAVIVVATSCAPGPGAADPFPTPPQVAGPSTTLSGAGTIQPEPGLSSDDVARATSSIEQALLTLGLQPSVTYDEKTSKFSVIATGYTPLDNAKLAESIIRIIGDPDQPGAIKLTHSQLKVRIRPDPNSDRQCSCGFQ